MDTMKITGYMNEVEWDGRTLRAKGTNKAAHHALLGVNDVDFEDYVKKDEAKSLGAAEVRARGKQAIKDTLSVPDALVLDADEFTVEKFKTANTLVNGQLVLRTREGRKYQLHFRKKHNDDFAALAASLGVTV